MPLKYLLDSTLLIDHFNKIPTATEFLFEHFEECAVSVVSLAELLSRPSDSKHIEELDLLEQFPVLTVETADAHLAADFRRKHRLKLPDAFQAALAKHHNLRLVTRNTKDFDQKMLSFVHIPYKI